MAVRARVGGYLVVAWLAGIIGSLLLLGDRYDVAPWDLGLVLPALALARLATAFRPPTTPQRSDHTARWPGTPPKGLTCPLLSTL